MRRDQRFPRGSRMAHLLFHSPSFKRFLIELITHSHRSIISAKTTHVLRIGSEIDSACAAALSYSYSRFRFDEQHRMGGSESLISNGSIHSIHNFRLNN